MTSSPAWPASARATASVVVPILMNSDEWPGTSAAAAAPISRLCGAATALRAS